MFQLSLDIPSVPAQVEEVTRWEKEFDALVERIGPHFSRTEARVRARDYLVGQRASSRAQERMAISRASRQPDPLWNSKFALVEPSGMRMQYEMS